MSRNANLSKAKNAKNDEFYTRLEDVEKELNEYDPTVFMPRFLNHNYSPTTFLVSLMTRSLYSTTPLIVCFSVARI